MEARRTYYIYDTIEKCSVKSGTNRRSLFRTADRMDYNYGGVRYVVRVINSGITLTSL